MGQRGGVTGHGGGRAGRSEAVDAVLDGGLRAALGGEKSPRALVVAALAREAARCRAGGGNMAAQA